MTQNAMVIIVVMIKRSKTRNIEDVGPQICFRYAHTLLNIETDFIVRKRGLKPPFSVSEI